MFDGRQLVNGIWGSFIWDGYKIAEVSSFEAKITIDREEVQVELGKDSKIKALAGEGTFKVKKIYSRGKKKMLEALKRGEDPRARFTGIIKDPNSPGKQSETVDIMNAWFNELTLMMFEKGEVVEEEFSFGFNPMNSNMIDEIEEL